MSARGVAQCAHFLYVDRRRGPVVERCPAWTNLALSYACPGPLGWGEWQCEPVCGVHYLEMALDYAGFGWLVTSVYDLVDAADAELAECDAAVLAFVGGRL